MKLIKRLRCSCLALSLFSAATTASTAITNVTAIDGPAGLRENVSVLLEGQNCRCATGGR